MKKRILSLIMILTILAAFTPTFAVQAAAGIDIGDYVQMGTYYGAPILWRCVDKDENGPLMLADKIICIKPFDAEGEANTTTGSHSRNSYRQSWGSNYWADSNMRSWLNSAASAGNVEWLCGNPPDEDHVWSGYNEYDKEAGFLTNFTQGELNAVKEVTQKSLLSYPEIDAGMAKTGTERHSYDSDIADVVTNYDTAYAEYVTDRMFLLDVKQVNAVYNNGNILGEDYYIGKLSEGAVRNSEYSISDNNIGKNWYYWFRSPYAYNSDIVRYIDSSGAVYDYFAHDGSVGVRPAFYLNLQSAIFKSGSGTENSPYTVEGTGGGNSSSTSSGAPDITSVKLTYGGKTYDIFKQNVTVEKDSDITASIEAEVDNNGCKNVKTYVTQGVGNEIDITGICKDIKPGKDLSAGKDIYIMAVDEDTGKSTSKKTKLKISSMASGKLGDQSGVEGLNFKLGQNTGFTIPDDVPVFGGVEIDWEFDFIPISVEYDKEDNNKVNVVFGTNITKKKGNDDREYFSDFDFKEYKKAVKKAASKQSRTLKQLRNDFKMTNDIKMNMFGGNLIGGGSGKKGNSVDVAGYAEMHVTENGLVFSEGQLCVNVEFTYNYQGQIFIWVVPLYYEFGGGAGVGLEGDMKNVNPISFSPEFEAYITGKVKGSIGGGVGIAKVATAGAAGEAALNLKKSLQNSYFKADVDGSANFNVKIFGKTVAEKVFASGNFLIYETGNSQGLIKDKNGIAISEDGEIYDTVDIDAVYENESRAYAENPTEWRGKETALDIASADYTNRDLKLLAENIYTESAPQICEIDGRKVMVTQWDNADRADIDRTMLVYSVYDDASDTWSEPMAVYDDGTADFYPCFKDGYLVWQNAKTALSDDMTLKEIARAGEIYAAKWNGDGFDMPIAITDNNSLDTLPVIAANGNGASIVWVTNSEDDILGTTGGNSIMRTDFEGASWSAAECVKDNLNAVTNITTGTVNGEVCVAYVTDDDNDLNTINDRDIHIISGKGETRLTDNEVLDSNPVFADNMIYYYSGGNIAYSDIDGSSTQTVFAEAKPGLTDSFVVDGNGTDTAIWWTKAVNGGAEVYATLCNGGEWSDEIQITGIGNMAKYPSGILNDDGSMVVAFNNGILENNEVVKTDLYTVSVNPSYDLELTDAYINEDNMTVYATVKNSGELAVNSYTLTIDDNGKNAEKTITEPLKAGESAEVEIVYNKPADLTERNIAVTATADTGDEYNTQNNEIILSVGHADITVDNVSVNEEENKITADISNTGYTDAENVIVRLRENSADGTVISEQTVSAAVNELQRLEFTFDKSGMRFYASTKQLYITAEYDGEEASVGNNDGYAVITSPSGAADYQSEILSYDKIDGRYMINSVAVNNTDTELTCRLYTAVYSADGVLKGCGTVDAVIAPNNDTGVDISVPCEIESGDTIRMFMWKGQEPLSKAAEFTIE